MRMTLSVTIAAAALLAASPAFAQNDSAASNTDVAATNTLTTDTVTTNETTVAVANDMAVLPPADTNVGAADTGYATPPPEEKKGFPWGVLGLLGLLGLIPRARRGS
jgi:MYXO-CTERM domain-containing protein